MIQNNRNFSIIYPKITSWMTDFFLDLDLDLDNYYGFFDKLERAAAYSASAADCLAKATAFSEKVREYRFPVHSEKENARNAACLKEAQAQAKAVRDLNDQAIHHSNNAVFTMFFDARYSSEPFENLLVFLQRLPPKKAAKTLKHIIAIVTNVEVKKSVQRVEIIVSTGGKNTYLWKIHYFRLMEFVVKKALFCESIKINHRLNFSTNFLSFRVASLQYQGKMSQMDSIAYERLEMFKKKRLNLLTISAFLCFLFRKVFKFPNNYISPQMRRLLNK